jgi:hypothetical protein
MNLTKDPWIPITAGGRYGLASLAEIFSGDDLPSFLSGNELQNIAALRLCVAIATGGYQWAKRTSGPPNVALGRAQERSRVS